MSQTMQEVPKLAAPDWFDFAVRALAQYCDVTGWHDLQRFEDRDRLARLACRDRSTIDYPADRSARGRIVLRDETGRLVASYIIFQGFRLHLDSQYAE